MKRSPTNRRDSQHAVVIEAAAGIEHSGGRDYFSFKISVTDNRTTRFFSMLVKVSVLLLMLDKYLLSNFKKLKQNISHVLRNDSFEQIVIQEKTAYDGEAGVILQRFLKKGKELILSSLQYIETTSDLDALLKKVSELVYQTQEELRLHDFLDVLSSSSLDKVALAKILNSFWLYFSNSGATAPITIESVQDTPQVMFTAKPPLREWLPQMAETRQPGRLELRHIDFGDSKKWKAVLLDYLHDRAMVVEIADLNFLDSLKSTEENVANGILHGDIIVATYTTQEDLLTGKMTITVLEIHRRFRQSQVTQLNLFTAETVAATETSPALPSEKNKKAAKKKHRSWR